MVNALKGALRIRSSNRFGACMGKSDRGVGLAWLPVIALWKEQQDAYELNRPWVKAPPFTFYCQGLEPFRLLGGLPQGLPRDLNLLRSRQRHASFLLFWALAAEYGCRKSGGAGTG